MDEGSLAKRWLARLGNLGPRPFLRSSSAAWHRCPPGRAIARPPPRERHPHGIHSFPIPRALAQALEIVKGREARWVLKGGELVLRLK